MKRQSAAATLALLLLMSSPALAWNPFREEAEPQVPAQSEICRSHYDLRKT